MFREQMEAIGDQLRHLLLNPPLAPGTLDADGNALSSTDDPLLLRYLPLMVLLTLFWPVLVTLIAASISASAWLFWLAIGLIGGVLQLLYVLYNFMMITWDLSSLTVLKTFAMLRSVMRYYFYKMTNAAGLDIKGRRKQSKKRRRKEWREDEDKANTYEEYCQLEIYEPEQQTRSTITKKSGKGTPSSKPKYVRRDTTPGGEKLTKRNSMRLTARPPKSPAKGNNSSSSPSNHQISSPGSPMKKSFSSLDLSPKSGSSHTRKGSAFRGNSNANGGLRRVSSSALPLNASNEEDDNNSNGDERCPKWQQAIKDDLGMTGSMLLTTLSRLKEARMHANSMNAYGRGSSGNDVGDSSSDDDFDIQDTRGSSFHITSFSSTSLPSPGSPTRPPRNEDYSSSLKTLLSGIVKRNHLSVDDSLMLDARSIAERGQHSLKKKTREAIDRYGDEVERCMDWVASGAVYLGGDNGDDAAASATKDKQTIGGGGASGAAKMTREQVMEKQRDELSKRYTLFKRMKQNMGHTALMLSGGGAQAMYHLGTIKALCESGLYEHIHVISGTSGGSISAAMCAIKSPEELLRDVCVETVSTDYMLTGEMKRIGVSWFPSIYKMGALWMKKRLLMDSKEFLRCCEFYYGDTTFEEAFEMTGKHVCITVSASRASAGSGVQRLLLNHISTPNVTLASSVAASCAVPGVMAPAKLMIKDSRGKQVPFEVDGVEWIDGSVQADLPFKRISTLFNISNFVVAQTNFHVVPFLNKAHHPNINTLYWKMFQLCMWDVRSRVLNLSRLGLFPKIFGQDLSKMFNQKYHGKLTLVPRFTTLQLFGLKVLSNPTVADMSNYLRHGQVAAWPFLRVLREMLRFERSIDAGLIKLEQRLRSVTAGFDSPLPNDDVDSLSSAVGATYRARLPGLGREAELLKEKVRGLEQENKQLRQQVMHLQRTLGISHPNRGTTGTLEGRLVSVSVEEEDGNASSMEEKKTN